MTTVRLIRVFVSSPSDVKRERDAVDEAVQRINNTDGEARGVRLETFRWEKNVVPRIGPKPQKVVDSQTPTCDIYLGILSRRFGTPTGRHASGTEKEFADALRRWGKAGLPWILFYFNEARWLPKTAEEIRQWAKVCEFRQKAQKLGIVASYRTVRGSGSGFLEQVELHVRKVLNELAPLRHTRPRKRVSTRPEGSPARRPSVPDAYKDWLRGQCADIAILGLGLKHGQSVRLNNVYVPLATSSSAGEGAPAEPSRETRRYLERERGQLLLDLLGEKSLYLSGGPGSGKSTFCQWVAWLACEGKLPAHPIPPPDGFHESLPDSLRERLPLLVRLREFWQFLPELPDCPRLYRKQLEESVGLWVDRTEPGGLRSSVLEAHLRSGSALLILDGVDEVPLTRGEGERAPCPREMLVTGLIDAVPAWCRAGNKVLVTSRPLGIGATEARRLGLLHAEVSDLPEPLQELLVRRWFQILRASADHGAATAREMIEHLRGREELGALTANPMLLTAMCVVYNEGGRLPQDKADLYSRTVERVLFNRYPNDTALVDLVRHRLSAIAYGMHTGDGLGEERVVPQAQVSFEEIDRILAHYRDQSTWTEPEFKTVLAVREDLLSRSGLLHSRERNRADFYHLSFQDHLAAERLLELLGDSFCDVLIRRAATPEWRHTLSFAFASHHVRNRLRATALLERLITGLSGASDLHLQVVVADCLEILMAKGIRPPEKLQAKMREICLAAIEREVPVRERMVLGLTLGRLGDTRLVADLRRAEAYVEIPADTYLLGDERRAVALKKPFLIARCPVTNAQYRLFVEAGGYDSDSEWWSVDGIAWVKSEGLKEPRFWGNAKWNGANQPVVGVSFWEAEAFCNWAGARLPMEQEWEAAARGPEGLEYPWGNEWVDGVCNSSEAQLGMTSPVGLFPRSRSRAFGLEDMAGNVWEWTSSFYDEKRFGPSRVLRGGSWRYVAGYCRSASRLNAHPASRSDYFGFRPARSLPSTL